MRPDPAQPAEQAAAHAREQRSGPRSTTVLLIGKMCDGGIESACLVLNVSETGMMARLTRPFEVGDLVDVEMRGLTTCRATVRWVDGPKAGFEFARRQNVEGVIGAETISVRVARSPRFDVALAARLRIALDDIPAEIVDISAGGAKLAVELPVKVGQTGQILLHGRQMGLYGTVRWAGGDHLGFHFSTPLPLATLRDCLASGHGA